MIEIRKSRQVTGEAAVWDARTGAVLTELKGLKNGVNGVAFSPDGSRIVTTSGLLHLRGTELKVWDASTGELLLDLSKAGGRNGGLLLTSGGCVAYSPDGTRFVTGGFIQNPPTELTEATVWDAGTGSVVARPEGTRRPGCTLRCFQPGRDAHRHRRGRTGRGAGVGFPGRERHLVGGG